MLHKPTDAPGINWIRSTFHIAVFGPKTRRRQLQLSQDQCDAIGDFICRHRPEPITLEVLSDVGGHRISLTCGPFQRVVPFTPEQNEMVGRLAVFSGGNTMLAIDRWP